MPAVVDADDATKPLDNDATNYPASKGAEEFRALKAKVNELFLLAGVEADLPFLITLNGKSVYASVTGTPPVPSPMYGHSANITRTGGTASTVGCQFEARLADGVTGTDGMWGVIGVAMTGNTNSHGRLVGGNFEVASRDHNNDATIRGVIIKFNDRIGIASPASGLGSNKYNNLSVALQITSQERGAAGEYCGWNNGIVFDEYSMDFKVGGIPGYCIDTYALHFEGGGSPSNDYRVDGVMRLRVGQSILWDDGAGAKARLLFDYHAGSYMGFWAGNTMRFGVSIGDGHVNVPQMAGGGDRNVRVDNLGNLYAV